MCKEQVGTTNEEVTAHVMRICWPSTVDNKQTKKLNLQPKSGA